MSASNPMHRATMSKTKRSPMKRERTWEEIQSDKKKFLKRLDEQREAKERVIDWKKDRDHGDTVTEIL